MKIIPLGDRILINIEEVPDNVGGIEIPDIAKEKPVEGIVAEVGTGTLAPDGSEIPLAVSVGDKVLLDDFAGTDVNVGELVYRVVTSADIIAILG